MLDHCTGIERTCARYDVITGVRIEVIFISLFRLRQGLSNMKVKRHTFECDQLEDKFL